MTHSQKVVRVIKDLQARGVNPYTTAPPLFRLLWRVGIQIPPPLFLGFSTLVVLFGLPFGALWAGMMLVFMHRHHPLPPLLMPSAGAAAGLLFGVAMALLTRRTARRLRLPRWSNYPLD